MGTQAWASWSGRSGVWLVGVGLALAGACGGGNDDPPLNPTGAGAVGGGMLPTGSGGKAGAGGSGGKAGAGGTGGTTGEGGDAGETVTMPGAPIVEVTSPPAVTDPDGGGVLTESEIDVTCEVRAASGGQPVDPSTVVIQLLDAEDDVVDEVAAAPTGEPNEYSARVILENVEDNGVVGFSCSAGDTTSPPLMGTDTVRSLVDHGPLITVTSPVPESAHPLAGALRVRFSVDADAVGSGDSGAAVDTVTLEINGVSIDPGESDGGDYDVSVDLADPTVFADIPAGEIPLTITATNRRDPAATRVASYGFIVDGVGPEINITSPPESARLGGRIALHFTIVDDYSGVDRESVVVVLNKVDEYRYGEGGTWEQDGDEFVFSFDSTQAEARSKVQANINIRASDNVGNAADGESRNLYLDNQPPIVDLDPDHVRDSKESGDDVICSAAFDPVGPRAANDYPARQYTNEFTIARTPTIRAIVWEMTNAVQDQPILYHSGTDSESVFVYLQPNVSEALLVDTDMDGVCDELAIESLQFQHLSSIAHTGTAWYRNDGAAIDPAISGCILSPTDEDEDPLCANDASDMTRIIPHTMEGKPPVIYALLDGTMTGCTGTFWEIGAVAQEGWVCLAGRAVDHAGNVGISPPLRLCYDDPATSSSPDCAAGEATPPTCTDGCTPPPGYAGRIFAPEK
jgi:hypothetical protein